MRPRRTLAALATAAAAVTVTALGVAPTAASAAPTDLFISEYVEGSSNNKAIELYNGTGAVIDLAAGGYQLQMHFNGSTTPTNVALTGTVAAGDVFVLASSSAAAAILAQADQTTGASLFNGDDAIVLRRGTTVLDSIEVGVDRAPGGSTADNTLRRLPTTAGDPT
jgi:predicted extracellular nuclease